MLNGRRLQVGAYLAQNVFPGIAIAACHPDLDQFMGVQTTIDFRHYSRRQAAVADQYDWVERLRAGPQRAALAGIQWNGQGIILEGKL